MNHVIPPVWRAIRIVTTIVLHAARWAVVSLLPRARGSRRKMAAERLVLLLEALGPTFIKGGQLLSTRADLLPPPVIQSLRRLQDQVYPVSARRIRRELRRGLGERVAGLRDFQLTPIATGSIAQVHVARLDDGRTVAVKIRRPGVAAVVRRDARLFRLAVRLIARLPPCRSMPVVSLVEEIIGPLVEQIDFRIEADNNRRLRRSFAFAERVRIPALVEGLCSESVLTLEYVADLQRVTSPRLTMQERADAALAGLRALYRMIFVDGFVHADMHDSNIFVREWGELVILDTGFVARLTPAVRRDFVDFFFGLANGRGDDCARIIMRGASALGAGFDETGFRSDVRSLVGAQADRSSSEFELSKFVADLFVVQRKWQVRGSTAFIMTVVAMLVFEGICKQLYPACDFQREARGFLVIGRYAAGA